MTLKGSDVQQQQQQLYLRQANQPNTQIWQQNCFYTAV